VPADRKKCRNSKRGLPPARRLGAEGSALAVPALILRAWEGSQTTGQVRWKSEPLRQRWALNPNRTIAASSCVCERECLCVCVCVFYGYLRFPWHPHSKSLNSSASFTLLGGIGEISTAAGHNSSQNRFIVAMCRGGLKHWSGSSARARQKSRGAGRSWYL